LEEPDGGFPIAAPPAEEESPAERRLRDSERLLRLYSFGDELLYVGNDGGSRVIVRTDGRRGVRTYFDDAMRMVRRERWELSGGMEAELSAVERYRYGSSSVPVSAVILEDGERRVLRYDEAGRLSECRIYVRLEDVPEDGLRPAGVSKDGRVLRSLTRWQYAVAGRLGEAYYEEYEYEKGVYSRPASVRTRRDVYEYKIEGGAPDYYYYEDGVIRMQTVYSAPDSYVTTLYFDGGFVVESYYTDGRHTKDFYYLDGTLRRRRFYDE
ncbi:MAG: hypothetical protein K2H09_05655, partial [Treponemataceae bacterium]|nr:hypothetical protein [Treponemataceae bacterium]